MTCIIGIVEKGIVTIGGDSLVSSGSDVCSLTPKVFRKGNFIIGCSASARAAQLLQLSFQIPQRSTEMSSESYIVNEFINGLHDFLKTHAITSKKDGEAEDAHIWFLAGYEGKLYKIWSDFSFNCFTEGQYTSAGYAGSYAIGALSVLPKTLQVRKKILLALKTAEKHSTCVRRPFTILSEKIK